MSIQNEVMPFESEDQVQHSRGCVFYGCLTAAVLGVGAILCCGIGPYWFITSQVRKYTAEAPIVLPAAEYSEERVAALEKRLSTFKETLDAGETPQDLVLTADEINALIGKEEQLRGKVFVKIENGEITGEVSIPADAVWGGDGRYFNASASFQVTMEDGILIVTMSAAEVKGEPVPEEYMQAIGKENLAKDVYKDAENANMLRRFESIEVVDDKLILKLRRDTPNEEQAADIGQDPAAEQTEVSPAEPVPADESSEASDDKKASSEGDAKEIKDQQPDGGESSAEN